MATCTKCEAEYGISCKDETGLFWIPTGWSFIRVKNLGTLQVKERVRQCAVLTGEEEQETLARKILENAKKAKEIVPLPEELMRSNF
jgi:hypothetical protein